MNTRSLFLSVYPKLKVCKRQRGQPRTPTALSVPLTNIKLGSLGKPSIPSPLVFARGDKGTHADIGENKYPEKEEGRKNVNANHTT